MLKAPDRINLADVITSIEGPIHLMECTIHKDACPLSSDCRISQKIREAQDCLIRIFRDTSISDIIGEDVNQEDSEEIINT